MAYFTGTAASFAAVKTALVNACVSDSWTNTADAGGNVVLSKSGVFVQVIADTAFMSFLGRTSLNAGDAPGIVTIGDIIVGSPVYGVLSDIVSFPVTYHIFTFTGEVFLVINYSDKYQFAAFGLSTQAGLTGTGAFVSAAYGSVRDPSKQIAQLTSSVGGDSGRTSSMAMFYNTYAANTANKNSFLHNNIDPLLPWDINPTANDTAALGIKHLTELLDTQPNNFNGEAVLLPIRAYKEQSDNKYSQILDVANARHVRNDNYDNEQIITLGLDKWMVFPWYKKNTLDRDCDETYKDHTGTFGWAIKYEGP